MPLRAQNAGTSEAVRELSLLLAEQKESMLKVRQSVAQREQFQQQLKELDGQSAALKSDWEAIEALRPAIRQLCSGKVPTEKLAAAKQQCDAPIRNIPSCWRRCTSAHLTSLPSSTSSCSRRSDAATPTAARSCRGPSAAR
jgi:hypothetical protein